MTINCDINESRRVIHAAAILAERYMNPDVAAYSRKYYAEGVSVRRADFWFRVGRLLGAAYGRRGCPTNYEIAARRAIDAARAALAPA